jgi:multimeric flavodoxin WrbA
VILLGSPTRFGLPAAQLKQFIDTTGPLWGQGRLVDKIGSAFTSTATTHGGQESTILAMNNTFYHWGCIIVPPGYADPIQFQAGNPYGTSHTSQNGAIPPGELEPGRHRVPDPPRHRDRRPHPPRPGHLTGSGDDRETTPAPPGPNPVRTQP